MSSASTPVRCPFCGSRNLRVCGVCPQVFVRCLNCLAEGPGYNDSEAEAVVAWNQRAPQLQAMGEKRE